MIRTTEKFGESAGQGHLTLPRGLGVGSLRNTREARPEGRGEAGQAEWSGQVFCGEGPACEQALGRKETEAEPETGRSRDWRSRWRSQFMQSLVDHVKDLNSVGGALGSPLLGFRQWSDTIRFVFSKHHNSFVIENVLGKRRSGEATG